MSAPCDTFQVGTKVRSKKVGDRPAFDGVITGIMHGQYVVRDQAGDSWLRTKHELGQKSHLTPKPEPLELHELPVTL